MVEYEVEDQEGEDVRLRLRGELAGRLWTTHIRRALEDVDDGVTRIRADLSGLSFMDNFGIATLVALQRESSQRGKRFVVEGARGQVRDKLQVTGIQRVLQEGD